MAYVDPLLDELQRCWPGWRIWIVRYTGVRQVVWCALADAEKDVLPPRTLNADTPEELSAAMAARARELTA